MTIMESLLNTDGASAVVDSYALYHISTGHSEAAVRIRDRVSSGALFLAVPSVAFAVSSGMRNCWDSHCERAHVADYGNVLRNFHQQAGVGIIEPDPELSLSAGRLYAQCSDQRVVGSEVLASCHAVLLAEGAALPLLSVLRALYCYKPLSETLPEGRLHFIPTR
ncbi:hypothetical protein [Micromonospora carbonacea]|uniref:hypothetical protein n=1 Tax=Micromonospora carbonacea TaxID=47853 RepID=UPI003D73D454